MTRRTVAPFEPTTDSLRSWLGSIPADTRVELCLFLVTTTARSVFADEIDAAVAKQVETTSYAEVGRRFNWTKGNVQRRVTRHRERTGQKNERRSPRPAETEQVPAPKRRSKKQTGVETPEFVAP